MKEFSEEAGYKMNKEEIISKCRILLEAYNLGRLGYMKMPEDSNPKFEDNEQELRFSYFTLPMALNYQRDSYKLWESALKTIQDNETKEVFDIKKVSEMDFDTLKNLLLKYRLALQPNKHTNTWQVIAKTINSNFNSFTNLFSEVNSDFLRLKEVIQVRLKQGFPYLSGPKIFNYWSFIIQRYGNMKLKNSDFIEIAPDTHVTKCSVILGVINEDEAQTLSKEEISKRWRELLSGTGINPIDMHPPLWFWSRNNFQFKLEYNK